MKGIENPLMTLSDEEVRLLKREKRIAYVLSSIIILFGLLFSLVFVLLHSNLILLIGIDVTIALICTSIPLFMNRKYNFDIRHRTKMRRLVKVQSKNMEISYEPGSGNLYIPILGDLFPKLWGQKMRASNIYFLNIENIRYEVDKTLYDSVSEDDFVVMNYGKQSNLLLGIEKVEQKAT